MDTSVLEKLGHPIFLFQENRGHLACCDLAQFHGIKSPPKAPWGGAQSHMVPQNTHFWAPCPPKCFGVALWRKIVQDHSNENGRHALVIKKMGRWCPRF